MNVFMPWMNPVWNHARNSKCYFTFLKLYIQYIFKSRFGGIWVCWSRGSVCGMYMHKHAWQGRSNQGARGVAPTWKNTEEARLWTFFTVSKEFVLQTPSILLCQWHVHTPVCMVRLEMDINEWGRGNRVCVRIHACVEKNIFN